jgi:hypothetical protein
MECKILIIRFVQSIDPKLTLITQRTGMEVQTTNLGDPSLLNWERCIQEAQKIKGFAISLNAEKIGTGLLRAEGFCLLPRSQYINNYSYQWIATVGDKDSTFTSVLETFTTVVSITRELKIIFLSYSPKKEEDISPNAEKFLFLLIKIQSIINGLSSNGLIQLCTNYRSLNKSGNADSLQSLGKEAFDNLSAMENDLEFKMLKLKPDLRFEIDLRKFHESTKKILKHRHLNCTSLLQTQSNLENGAVISNSVITDCIRDAKHRGKKPNKEALRIAANFICLPMSAHEITTQNPDMHWMPLRLVINSDRTVSFEDGVVGTCERNKNETQNICNVYYRIDPRTQHLIISCGAINTPSKAEQLVAVICKVVELLNPDVNGRWHVHGLYSFYHEEALIQGVHNQIPHIEEELKKKLGKKDIFLSHINTVFNAASNILDSEDSKSLMNINIDCLAQFISYTFEDIFKLLKKDPVNQRKFTDLVKSIIPEEFSALFMKIIPLSAEIKVLKSEINQPIINSQNKQINTLKDQKKVTTLLQKQTELEAMLKQSTTNIKASIIQLEVFLQEEEDIYLKKALLILKVLDRILVTQLKCADTPPLSRCAEVELFLLFYRLLDIKTIIICMSGLDRSGAVRALADTQSLLEREWIEKTLSMNIESEILDEREIKARLAAHERMLGLILHLDDYQEELFKLTNTINAKLEDPYKLIKDINFFAKTNHEGQLKPEVNQIRESLLKMIDEQYASDKHKADQLKMALFYMERYAAQLFGTEMLKTIYSTGAAGFKWQQDSSWSLIAANPHPTKRVPPFIFTHDHYAILLLEYVEGWFGGTMSMTPAGMSLLLRLSQLRGK